jgi:hypothetical protein
MIHMYSVDKLDPDLEAREVLEIQMLEPLPTQEVTLRTGRAVCVCADTKGCLVSATLVAKKESQ